MDAVTHWALNPPLSHPQWRPHGDICFHTTSTGWQGLAGILGWQGDALIASFQVAATGICKRLRFPQPD